MLLSRISLDVGRACSGTTISEQPRRISTSFRSYEQPPASRPTVLTFLTLFLALHDSTDPTDQTMSDDTDQRASKRARVDNDDAGQPEPSASKPVAESANGQPAEAKHVNGDTAEKLEAVDEEDDEDDDPYGLNEASNGQSGDSAAPAGDLYLDTASFAGRMLLRHYKLTSTSADQPERAGLRL